MSTSSSRSRALIFDYGGVIMRTDSQQGRLRLARRFGMSTAALSEAVFGNEFIELAELGQLSARQFGRHVGAQFGLHSDAEISAFWDEFFGDDVLDTALVERIRHWRRTHKTALLSNFSDSLLDYVHNRLGIGDCFDEIIVSACVGLRKPDRRIYELALQRLQVEPHHALFVDDMEVNVEGARAAGLHAIRFTHREAMLAEIEEWLNSHSS